MKYQFLITDLLCIWPISTRIRNMTLMKRQADVMRDHIFRVRVARFSWSFVRSGTTVGDDAACDRLRLKNCIVMRRKRV